MFFNEKGVLKVMSLHTNICFGSVCAEEDRIKSCFDDIRSYFKKYDRVVLFFSDGAVLICDNDSKYCFLCSEEFDMKLCSYLFFEYKASDLLHFECLTEP